MTFEKQMQSRLESIRDVAKSTARFCASDEYEGCVLYENLLNLEVEILAAIKAYVEDAPACDRDSIRRMNDAAHGKAAVWDAATVCKACADENNGRYVLDCTSEVIGAEDCRGVSVVTVSAKVAEVAL